MTLEEKIEVIRAFSEGKPVEGCNKEVGLWEDKVYDIWDFDDCKYRIKPDKDTKFKVGDKLVYKSDEGYSNVEVYEITDIAKDSCTLDGMINRTFEHIEKEFINVDDVLLYFEIYNHDTKKYYMHPTRMTISDMDEEFAANHDTLSWKPIYTLGFRLPKADK